MGLEVIREMQKLKKMSNKELSAKSGVPLGTLNKILSGDTKDPKLETLKAIARVLGCSLDDFDDESPERFTVEEKNHIQKYRRLDNHGKDMVDTVLTKEYDRCVYEKDEPIIFQNKRSNWLNQQDKEIWTDKVAEDSIPYLSAAHNDQADDPEEQKKMRRDIDKLKDME